MWGVCFDLWSLQYQYHIFAAHATDGSNDAWNQKDMKVAERVTERVTL